MAAVTASPLAGLTVTYNGVQFGGSDAAYKSTPPEYSFRGEPIPDESGRVTKAVRYVLTVRSVFYEATEGVLATNLTAIKRLLSQQARELKIEGMGTGFGTVSNDAAHGPKVLSCDFQSIGQIAWELLWVVEFVVVHCESQNHNPLAFLTFNFATTWQNDFQGTCQRTISGHAEIVQHRNPANPKIVAHVADEVRDSILTVVPAGFRRMTNVWQESMDHARLDFVFVDEQMPGTSPPPGVIVAQGSTEFDSQGPGFAQGAVTMAMTLRTAPGVAPSTAGVLFIAAVIKKQNAMQAAMADSGGTVIPRRLRIANRKFDDASITDCSFSWEISRCLAAILKAAGIWEPVTEGDYTQWRTSIQHLWGNRGTAGLRSAVSEAAIIDLCNNATTAIIGDTPSAAPSANASPSFTFGCPEIPPDGGWLGWETKLRILRNDRQSWHRRAISYLPSIGQPFGQASAGQMPLGGPSYEQAAAERHVVEYHGLPEVYVALQFKGLRIKHLPEFPQLLSVAGHPAHFVRESDLAPRLAFDVFQCPVYYVEGYRIYRINGYVPSVKKQGSKTSCADNGVIDAY